MQDFISHAEAAPDVCPFCGDHDATVGLATGSTATHWEYYCKHGCYRFWLVPKVRPTATDQQSTAEPPT